MATAAQTTLDTTVPPGAPAQEPVLLNGKIEILPGSPMAGLNAAGGPAFTARSQRDRKAELFAVVCNGGLPARTDSLSSLRSVEHASLMRLHDWGVVDWAPDGVRRFVLVFERPAGRRLMGSLGEGRDPMTEDQVTRLVIEPLVGALSELQSRAIVHGDIRPTNLFLREQASGVVMLGECVSTLPSYAQEQVCLTVERAMAHPAGRGAGTSADDLYAFGVTILMLLMGRNPVKHLDDEAVLQTKIERGSYPALVGQQRISLNMMEPLRGLLSDDPKQRWTLQDLELWISGRRLSPKQPQVPRKGARPFEFQGQNLQHSRSLARAFARSPVAAAQAVESGDLDRWLRRSLGDDVRAEAVQGAVDSAAAAGRSGSYEDRLVSRVCMALDPPAPIRYKGKSMTVDAIGGALAEAYALDRSPQAVAEAVAAQLPMFWVNVQPDFRAEYVPLVQTFDAMRSFLERPGPGFGVERVLYELNPTMACISPMVRDHHPVSPTELMAALEAVASSPNRPKDPLDRHVVAFVAARFRKLDERIYALVGGGSEATKRTAAMLNVLGDIQRRFGPPSLPGLCAWMAELIEPAVDRFHSRPKRERLRIETQKAARTGEIANLLRLVDDPDQIRKDEMGFQTARRDYERMGRETERLQREIDNRDEVAETLGRQVAAISSSILGTLLLVAIVILKLGS